MNMDTRALEEVIAELEVQRGHYETRAERCRALANGNPMIYSEKLYEAEYNDGVRYGLDIALTLVRRV